MTPYRPGHEQHAERAEHAHAHARRLREEGTPASLEFARQAEADAGFHATMALYYLLQTPAHSGAVNSPAAQVRGVA